MIAAIDKFLNHITMYRLVLYYVAGLLIVAFGFGFLKQGPDPTALAFSVVLITAICWAANSTFSLLFRVPANTESNYITAFILALIMQPVTAADKVGIAGLFIASAVAIASKYLLAIGRRHIFNPVAIGVAVSAYHLIDQPATWWVGGNPTLLPFIIAGGLLVARKVQRFDMICCYILANLIVTFFGVPVSEYGATIKDAVMLSPLLFAGFAMLTEPLTSPQARMPRLIFAVIVGALSSPSIHVGEFYLTPELAFLVGNVFAFAASPMGRVKFTLLRVEKMASGCYDFVFQPNRRLRFAPGQYLDWTLDVRHADDRGNRRSFTIASAPGDAEVRLGVKFYRGPSAFKRSLLNLKPGDLIYGSHLGGSFILPRDAEQKLAFIAGGIGVTPFRSMVQDMIDRQDRRSVIMLYGNNKVDEIAYADVFERATWELGFKTVYAVADGSAAGANVHRGFIDVGLIQREVPDYLERIFYISGPRSMVVRFQKMLKDLGVSRSRIKVDFFPGFA